MNKIASLTTKRRLQDQEILPLGPHFGGTENTWKYFFLVEHPESRACHVGQTKNISLLLARICVSLFMWKTVKGALHDQENCSCLCRSTRNSRIYSESIFGRSKCWLRMPSPSEEEKNSFINYVFLPPPPAPTPQWSIELDENLNGSSRQWGRKLHSTERWKILGSLSSTILQL